MNPETRTAGQQFQNGLRKIGRHKAIVLGFLVVGIAGALAFRNLAIPRYEAEAQVVFGIRSMPVIKSETDRASAASQPGVLRTEMDIITSRATTESVVERMLPADKENLSRVARLQMSPMQHLTALLDDAILTARKLASKGAAEPTAAGGVADTMRIMPDDQLVDTVMAGVSANNDGQSYTIHIGYSSADGRLAAIMANLYATAYIEDQLNAKARGAERASVWLSGRLVELRRNLQASEAAVQDYRHRTDIVQDKQGTVTAQQMGEVNSELVQARAARLDVESHLATIRSVVASGGDIGSIPEAAASPLIASLRERLAELKRKQSEQQSLYTDAYPVDKNLEVDTAAILSQLDAELRRLTDATARSLQTARNKEWALENELAQLKRQFGAGSDAEVQLRILERESDANRAVYEAYLSRLKETTEQSKLQDPDAYLIASAVAPDRPAYPRSLPLLALGAVFGALAGVAVAFLCELFDRRLHSIEEVEELTGLRVLALMPSLPYARFLKPENYVLRRPGSLFSEALHTARSTISLLRSNSSTVSLVTSSIQGEGKTTFCLSLVRALAMDGHKVLLIDADLRRPRVGSAFGAPRDNNLADILSGAKSLRDAVRVDRKSGAHYISARNDVSNPHDLLRSCRMTQLIEEARQEYHTIIIDTPPVLMFADAALVAGLADHCVLFVRWGRTERDYVTHALRRLELYRVAISGIVLSHVDTRRHASFASGEAYYRSYRMPPKRRRRFRDYGLPGTATPTIDAVALPVDRAASLTPLG